MAGSESNATKLETRSILIGLCVNDDMPARCAIAPASHVLSFLISHPAHPDASNIIWTMRRSPSLPIPVLLLVLISLVAILVVCSTLAKGDAPTKLQIGVKHKPDPCTDVAHKG